MGIRFEKNDTLMLKGIAIILMICNHLYPITEWIYPENMYVGISLGGRFLASYIGGFGKICVSIFAFLTGYGMYYSYQKGILQGLKKSLKRTTSVFVTFWIILFLVYIPVMALCGVWQFDWSALLLNMFGFRQDYCKVAWYLRFYLEITLTFPLFAIILTGSRWKKKIVEVFGMIGLFIIIVIARSLTYKVASGDLAMLLWEYFNYAQLVLIGYYTARWRLLERSKEWIERAVSNKIVRFMLCGFVMVFIFVGRGVLKNIGAFNMDVFYSFLLLLSCWIILEQLPKFISKAFCFLGKYSTELWFLHAIFFIGNSMVQRIGYWPKLDVIILLWVIILLLPFSVLISKLKRRILGYLENFAYKLYTLLKLNKN